MDFNLTLEQLQIREEIRKVCKEFPDLYWREVDSKKDYPEAFVRKLSELGWLAALIPEASPRPATRRCTPWERSCGTAMTSRSGAICRKSPAANSACKPSASPSPTPVQNRTVSKPRQ